MVIYVDIDETIANPSQDLDYSKATPMKDRIEKMNNLYDMGHTIVYWTARGTMTGIDWYDVTLQQFKDWGVKYSDLKMGKPAYDIFIDDKNINSEDWFRSISVY
tara:strand:- start:40 stop:351 length:312 start_codon:yes stop_codon:yes gene_type:complete